MTVSFWFCAILAFLAVCYAFLSIVLFIGVSKLKRRNTSTFTVEEGKATERLPFVSILVPARDEELFIANCLESLIRQQYPSNRYEVVVVNDRSTDNTPAIIEGFSEKYRKIKYIVVDANISELTGKQNAMNEGLKYCSGEIILNTDADCIAGPLWVSRTVSYFTSKTGLTIGFSDIHHRSLRYNSRSFFSDLQAIDILFLMDSGAGAIGMNVPVSCLGRNIAYRKVILKDTGYHGIGYTITEDAALIHKVARNKDWKINVIYDRDAAVLTYAEESIKQFLAQRIRWIMGGQAIKTWSQIPLNAIFLFHLCLAVSFLLMIFQRSLVFVALPAAFVKASLDFVRCWRVCKEFGKIRLLKLFIPYEVFMVSYSILIWFGSIFIRRIRWKGDMYSRIADQ